MLTYDEAYAATNPDHSDEQRQQSALALIAGTAANEAYWNSRGELEALKAQAEGHGIVVAPGDTPPTDSVSQTESGGAIEGTSVDESTEPAQSDTGKSLPSPDNPVEAVAKLRAQLQSAGLEPEA